MDTSKVLPISIGLEHSSGFNSSYEELNVFREYLETQKLGPNHQPYQTAEQQALAYRIIFTAIGLLFLLFCGIIYTKSMTWTHTLFLHDGQFLKEIFYTLSGGLAAVAFWVAYQIRPEKEALSNLRKRARDILRREYHKRIAIMGVKRFLPQGKHQNELILVKHRFHDAWENVTHSTAVTRQLMAVIATSHIVSQDMRVKLFNQALLELQDKLLFIIQNYQ